MDNIHNRGANLLHRKHSVLIPELSHNNNTQREGNKNFHQIIKHI